MEDLSIRRQIAAELPAPVTTLDTENHPVVYREYPKVYAGVEVGFGRIKSMRQKSLSNIGGWQEFFLHPRQEAEGNPWASDLHRKILDCKNLWNSCFCPPRIHGQIVSKEDALLPPSSFKSSARNRSWGLAYRLSIYYRFAARAFVSFHEI